ncbi:MAG: hypothetical protein NZM65_06035 [Flavobacteriales bacterium]|nr:hypothetical protein [Flavobacteriales bacterium]MDW8410234.1 hypothetical protein [Flavobacteriales bacterium]
MFVQIWAQPINQFNEKGQKTGYWKIMSSDGRLISEGEYQNGVPVGIHKHYHAENGKLKAVLHWHNDGVTCSAQIFDPQGFLSGIGLYRNKKREGLWVFLDEKGDTIARENYINGLREGPAFTYYGSSKSLLEELVYKKDLKNGPYRKYYENKQVEIVGTYRNDTLTGKYIVYSPDGKKQIEGYYDEKGLKTGKWFIYDERGIQKEIIEYKNGFPQGPRGQPYKEEEKPIEVITPDGPRRQ